MRAFALVLLGGVAAWAAPVPDVTFHRDVEPILQARCQGCHRAGEAAPMAFMSYQETRPWAKAIREAVRTQKMPPWFADPAHGSFTNDRRLSEKEIATLAAWADSGAKEGDPKSAPKPQTFTTGWTIGQPDVVFEMPHAYKVPAAGTVDYTYFVVPTGFTEDRWIQDVEVRPGARQVVHHIVLYAREPGSKFMKDAKPGEAYTPKGEPSKAPEKADDGTGYLYGLSNYEMIGVYVPGGDAYRLKPGQGRLVKAGSDIIFQMHYTSNGKAAEDQSRVGLTFAKEAPKERVVNAFVMNTNFRIPPGAPNFGVTARVKLEKDTTLLTMFPHMHLRGKAFTYTAVYPTGEREVLLDVPKYDFNWQLSYYLNKPRLLPKGTVIECVARFDNSPNNPANPDPSKEVYWGEQSWEEMVAGFVDLTMSPQDKPVDLVRPKKAPVPAAAGAAE